VSQPRAFPSRFSFMCQRHSGTDYFHRHSCHPRPELPHRPILAIVSPVDYWVLSSALTSPHSTHNTALSVFMGCLALASVCKTNCPALRSRWVFIQAFCSQLASNLETGFVVVFFPDLKDRTKVKISSMCASTLFSPHLTRVTGCAQRLHNH
jgi:hypothetical protein